VSYPEALTSGAWLAWLIAVLMLARRPSEGASGWRWPTVIVLATGLRLAAAMTPSGGLELPRYLWDGVLQLEGASPYRFAPGEVFPDAFPGMTPPDPAPGTPADAAQALGERVRRRAYFGVLVSEIARPRNRSPHPPGAQLVFLAGALAAPGEEIVYKILIAELDLAVCLLLAAVLTRWGRPRELCAVYALCPAAILFGAHAGGTFPLAAGACLGAVLLDRRGFGVPAGVGIGLAAAVWPPILITAVVGVRRLGPGFLAGLVGLTALLWTVYLTPAPPGTLARLLDLAG
jgi:hypothetical protein